MKIGVVLHHGDIPQETREVLESAVRNISVSLVICTSTLAEGVNLPIRTLVLYSVVRSQGAGERVSMNSRDIKNLIGRAGRAGANTKGLVICANPGQWELLLPVANQVAAEPVHGALITLVRRLEAFLIEERLELTNAVLEDNPALNSLVDGVDSTLINLIAEEIGEGELIQFATNLADQTYASRQAEDSTRGVLEKTFQLRAERVSELRESGRITWLRQSGARLRLVDSVEKYLLPQREAWDDIADPLDSDLVLTLLDWAWTRPELETAIRQAYKVGTGNVEAKKQSFYEIVMLWLRGKTFRHIAQQVDIPMDDMLGIYTRTISFELQSLLEQATTILSMLLRESDRILAPAVERFPEHLRFGVPTEAALKLVLSGLRHRSAAVALGRVIDKTKGLEEDSSTEPLAAFTQAHRILINYERASRRRLGDLVYEASIEDFLPKNERVSR